MLLPNEPLLMPVDTTAELISYIKSELPEHFPSPFSVSSRVPKDSKSGYVIWIFSSGGDVVDRDMIIENTMVNLRGPDEDVLYRLAGIVHALIRVAPLKISDIASTEPGVLLPASEGDDMPRFFFSTAVYSTPQQLN